RWTGSAAACTSSSAPASAQSRLPHAAARAGLHSVLLPAIARPTGSTKGAIAGGCSEFGKNPRPRWRSALATGLSDVAGRRALVPVLRRGTSEAGEDDAALGILEWAVWRGASPEHVVPGVHVLALGDLQPLQHDHRVDAVVRVPRLDVAGRELDQHVGVLRLGIHTQDL